MIRVVSGAGIEPNQSLMGFAVVFLGSATKSDFPVLSHVPKAMGIRDGTAAKARRGETSVLAQPPGKRRDKVRQAAAPNRWRWIIGGILFDEGRSG